VGDPLTLRQRLIPKNGQTVAFTILRSAKGSPAKAQEISIPLTLSPALIDSDMNLVRGGAVDLDAIGAAYRVERKIAAVDPNTPAAKAGLEVGDEIQTVNFVPTNDKQREAMESVFAPDRRGFLAKLFGVKKPTLEPVTLDDETHNWLQVHAAVQAFDPASKYEVTYARAGKTQSATLTSAELPDSYDETRGLAFYSPMVPHKAKDWGEAVQLGFRETKERLTEVATVLTQLGSGQLSITNISGPAGILGAAGSHANAGIAPLFMFLTLLSANLAIINFLPIPALDGGHMLFLMAEWIRGKPVDAKLQMTLTLFGIACLLSLMVFATFMDIGRFMS